MSENAAAWRRAIEKKLRHIEELKERASGRGPPLNSAQREKLASEAELRGQLEAALAAANAAPSMPPATVPNATAVESASANPRAIEKKLRQIAELKARLAAGDTLDDRQREKISREAELRANLAALNENSEQSARPPPDESDIISHPPKRPRPIESGHHGANGSQSGAATIAPAPAWDTRSAPVPPDSALAANAAAADAEGAACSHCGRTGHMPRVCTFGLRDGEAFLRCPSTGPAQPCFPRLFVVPLRRAVPSFDPAALRDGRVDVGVRCVSASLFRSQSIRQNTTTVLCFGNAPGGSAGSLDSGGGQRIVEVRGALVRNLRPDEHSLARRIRAVSDGPGAAAADAAVAAARSAAAAAAALGEAATDDGPVGAWSRGETRGISSRDVLSCAGTRGGGRIDPMPTH